MGDWISNKVKRQRHFSYVRIHYIPKLGCQTSTEVVNSDSHFSFSYYCDSHTWSVLAHISHHMHFVLELCRAACEAANNLCRLTHCWQQRCIWCQLLTRCETEIFHDVIKLGGLLPRQKQHGDSNVKWLHFLLDWALSVVEFLMDIDTGFHIPTMSLVLWTLSFKAKVKH